MTTGLVALVARRGRVAGVIEHLVVMGVSGTGKSTVGRVLADRLGWPLIEGDDLHPAANVAKMHGGIPLTDEDRGPWLRAVRDAMNAAGGPTVVACSALRRSYRGVLRTADGRVRFLLLVADPAVLVDRLANRPGHFMPASLLTSQLATLEPLTPDEDGLTVESQESPNTTASAILRVLTPGSADAAGHQPRVPGSPLNGPTMPDVIQPP